MSTVTVEQFSTADLTTEVFDAASSISQSTTEQDLRVAIQGTPYELKLTGTNFQYAVSGVLNAGTIIGLAVFTLPGGGAASSQEISIAGLNLPVATFNLQKTFHNDFDFQAALFGGADTFTIPGPGPGPDFIDGGAGNDILKFSSDSTVNGFAVYSLDGSSIGLAVAGATAVVRFANIESVQFSDLSVSTGGMLLPIIEAASAYFNGGIAAASAVSAMQSLASGETFKALEAEIANSQGVDLGGLVVSLYDAYLARGPTAQESSYWVGQFQAGSSDYGTLSSALAGQAGAAAHMTDAIDQPYEALTGSGPTAAELGSWKTLVGAGYYRLSDVYQSAAAGAVASAELAVVAAAYADYIGRAPSSDETNYWLGQLSFGTATLGDLHNALVSTGDGQARLGADVGQLYDTLIGRDPTSDETHFWTGQLQSGQVNVDQLRLTLEGTAQSRAFVPTLVDGLYDAFLGRDPSAGETAYWTGLVETGVLQAAQVQQALASQPGAAAIIQADVTVDYQRDVGRGASAGELAFWTGQIQGGFSLGALDRLLVGTGAGQAHAGAEVNALYLSYFGHAASAAELGYWTPRVQSGQTSYAQIADVLATIGGSGVYQTMATANPDHYAFSGAFGHIVISAFDPVADTLGFTGRPGLLPLAHAETVADGSGHFDTLITLDPTDTILLKGVALGQLFAHDFLVS